MRKVRTTISAQQIKKLEKKFTQERYISKVTCCKLASTLRLTEHQVKTWFKKLMHEVEAGVL